MAKPGGTSSSILVVVAPSFSVGTDRVKYCREPLCATGGLTTAWAEALGAVTASAPRAPAMTSLACKGSNLRLVVRRRGRAAPFAVSRRAAAAEAAGGAARV